MENIRLTMAYIDYGVIVKKNGKIITDPKGGLFQNYTNLKCTEQYLYDINYDENDEPAIAEPRLNPEYIDETIVTYREYNWEDGTLSDKIKEYSFGHNEMGVIGDEHFLIGFYKQDFSITIDKIMVQEDYSDTMWWDWFREHKKPLIIKLDNVPEVSDIVISSVNKDLDYLDKFFAKFTYKDDEYEVLFGYGVDPNPKYCYGKQSYFYDRKRRYDHEGRIIHQFPGRIIKKQDRKTLKIVKEWYEKGI